MPSGSDSHMQVKMGNLEAWVVRNNMEINTKKTKEMRVSFRKSQELQFPEPIRIRNSEIERES